MVGQGCCSDHRDNADWAGLACLFRQGKRQSRSLVMSNYVDFQISILSSKCEKLQQPDHVLDRIANVMARVIASQHPGDQISVGSQQGSLTFT
jgi:hypothetical protein